MPERPDSVSKGSDLPTLEFRIPISPTDGNMRMVRYFLESIRCFGGPITRSAHTVLSVGDKAPPFDLRAEYPWVNDHNIDIHWVKPEHFAKWQYNATGLDRFWIPSKADVVAKIDADLLVAGDFDDIVLRAYREHKVLGFMAHVSPFGMPGNDGRSSTEWWADMYHAAGVQMPELTFQYSAWGLDTGAWPDRGTTDPAHRYGPAYFNAGVVVGPREHFEQMGTTIAQDLDLVLGIKQTGFAYQIAHPICCARHGIACDTLSINYNFPMNTPADLMRSLEPDTTGGNRHEDTKIFHYIEGRKFFESSQTILDLINDDTRDGAWPVFQERLREVHEAVISTPQNLLSVSGPGQP